MEETINIEDIIHSIINRWKIIVISLLTTTIIGAGFTFFIVKPQYEASTKLFIGKEENGQGYSNSDVAMYKQLLKTYSELIKTKDLVKNAIADTNIDIKPKEVLSGLSVTPVADTQIMEIKYKAKNQKDAVILLESIKDEFIALSKELVPNGNIQELENVSGTGKPISPNKGKNIILSIVLGLVIGFGIVALIEILDNTFRTKDELERLDEIPVLGTIPVYEGTNNKGAKHHGRKRN